jgi:predicted small secreted protein
MRPSTRTELLLVLLLVLPLVLTACGKGGGY